MVGRSHSSNLPGAEKGCRSDCQLYQGNPAGTAGVYLRLGHPLGANQVSLTVKWARAAFLALALRPSTYWAGATGYLQRRSEWSQIRGLNCLMYTPRQPGQKH